MNGFLEFYEQEAKARRSSIPWLAKIQTQAALNLNKQGFPSRHDEDWKYTNIDSLLKQSFSNEVEDEKNPKPFEKKTLGHQLFMHNGVLCDPWGLINQLPEGVIVLPLSQALIQCSDLVQPYLGSILHQKHAFHFLNTALIECGLFFYIPEDVFIEEPIVLTHIQDKENQAIHLRHLIIAQAKSHLVLVEEYQGPTNVPYLTNTVTEIKLGSQAQLDHYKIQNESKKAYHFGHIAVSQAERSQFSSHSLSLGGALVRSDLDIELKAQNAHCLMNGIYAPAEGQHVDHHTQVHHQVPDCSSLQDYKGILNAHSRAVFNGKVIVAPNAQHTNAKQQNKNLLLSEKAEIDTKPQLEIFADDVLCTHGATVGRLDEEALFYLTTRGISRKEASYYLIHAFAQDNLNLVPHQKLAVWMGDLLTQQLELANEY